ncbi:MAG: molybdate ABC transporter substrate-binding protein [Hyphomicrobiaceae bacterium]|nr:molybdate ABC transporter substrate-binding protein [Hyphomicrobiaceae bacterium]
MVLTPSARADTVNLYAAGSLRAALTEVARAFEAEAGSKARVETTFGASGLLRERIEKGELAHVFASADTGHPKRLGERGLTSAPMRVFARNELCALVRQGLDVTPGTLLDAMLDPKVRVGTSTPKADPSGDYAFALFGKAEALKPGAKAKLESKALQLTGGPSSPKGPEGRSVYAWVMASGQADLFLTYCTNAVLAKKEAPELSIVPIPKAINVGAEYGLVVLKNAPGEAGALADYILSDNGQKILQKYGFGPGG